MPPFIRASLEIRLLHTFKCRTNFWDILRQGFLFKGICDKNVDQEDKKENKISGHSHIVNLSIESYIERFGVKLIIV